MGPLTGEKVPRGLSKATMGFPRAFQSYVPRTHCVETQTYGAILVSPDDEVLVVKGRKCEKWSFPKGHGRQSELPLEAAIREVREETGINLEGKKPDCEKKLKVNSKRSGGIYFVFKMDAKPDIKPEDTEEIMEAMWCPRSRLSSLVGNMDLSAFCRQRFHLDANLTTTESTAVI